MHSYPHIEKKNGEAIWDRWGDWYQRIFLFKKCTLWDEKKAKKKIILEYIEFAY